MLLPQINQVSKARQYVQNFGGINRNKRINTGELSDAVNITCDNYPILKTRRKRYLGNLNGLTDVSGMQIVNDVLYFVARKKIETETIDDETGETTVDVTYEYHLYKNNAEVSGYTFTADKKQTAVMGGYIIIFPDKVSYNTLDGTFESLTAEWSKSYKVEICDSLYKKIPSASGSNNLVKFGIALTVIKSTSSSKYTDEREALIKEINALLSKWGIKNFGANIDGFYAYSFDVDDCEFYRTTLSSDCQVGGVDADTGDFVFYNKFTSVGAAVRYNYFMNLRDNELCVLTTDSSTSEQYYRKDTPYLKISGAGIAEMFDTRDIVNIEKGTAASTSYIQAPGNSYVVFKSDTENDCIYVQGVTYKNNLTVNASNVIKIIRTVPDMDFIISFQNRLYGCKFQTISGTSVKSLNEIYVSKLGAPGNFTVATGSDDTGYIMSCGENGEFTAVAAYNGNVLFFKEDCIISINSYFSSSVSKVKGVQRESSESVCLCAGYLVYLSTDGFYAFNGETSIRFSDALGDDAYRNACMGEVLGNKYYCAAVNGVKYDRLRGELEEKTANKLSDIVSKKLEEQGITSANLFYNIYKKLFEISCKLKAEIETRTELYSQKGIVDILVYDFDKQMWTKEQTEAMVVASASDGRHIYYADFKNNIVRIDGYDTVDYDNNFSFCAEPDFGWSAESGELGYSYADAKYVGKINIRVRVPVGSKLRVSIEYDSNGKKLNLYNLRDIGIMSVNLSISPHRCDHFKILISGQGECDIISAAAKLVQGSDK